MRTGAAERNELVVACVQIAGGASGKAERIERVAALVRSLPPVDLIVLPELWPTGYFNFDRYERDAEPLGDGATHDALRELAIGASAWIVGSLVERSDGALYNTAPVVTPDGELAGAYRKRHLFGYESREAELLHAGTDGAAIELAGVRVGLALCYDLRFPEAFSGYVASACEVYVLPATWPRRRVDHWRALLAARAIEGQAFCVGCNVTGRERDVELGGDSRIVDPWGRCSAAAGTVEGVAIARLDLAAQREYRADFGALTERSRLLTARGGR